MSSGTAAFKNWSDRLKILNKRHHQERLDLIQRQKTEHLNLKKKHHPHVLELISKTEEEIENGICCKFNLEARRIYTSSAIESELRKSFVLHKGSTKSKGRPHVQNKADPPRISGRARHPGEPQPEPGIRGKQRGSPPRNPRSPQQHDLAHLPHHSGGISNFMLPDVSRLLAGKEDQAAPSTTQTTGGAAESSLHGRNEPSRHSSTSQREERQLNDILGLRELGRICQSARAAEPRDLGYTHSRGTQSSDLATDSTSSSSENSYSISGEARYSTPTATGSPTHKIAQRLDPVIDIGATLSSPRGPIPVPPLIRRPPSSGSPVTVLPSPVPRRTRHSKRRTAKAKKTLEDCTCPA